MRPSPIHRLCRVAFAAAAAVALAACGSDPDPYVERPVEDLYNEAMDDLQAGDFSPAATAFEEVERQHPYSVWATKAQLMAAYSYYQSNQYDQAVLAAQRFIELHPGNPDAAYAHYLIGLSYYEQISDVGRDQRNTELALQTFDQIRMRIAAHDPHRRTHVGRFCEERIRTNTLCAFKRRFHVVFELACVQHYPIYDRDPTTPHNIFE